MQEGGREAEEQPRPELVWLSDSVSCHKTPTPPPPFSQHLRDALLTSVASLVTRGAPCSLCCGVLPGLAWAGTVEVHYGHVLNAVHK